MIDLLKGDNSGVQIGVRSTDFFAGSESGVVYVAVNPSGDWTKYRPTDEWQRRYIPPSSLGYDTNSCTDFSCLNSIEAQITRMLEANEIPTETVNKMKSLGYFQDGRVNFNDWYNAITAGTNDATGNTLYATWDAVRKYGLIPQSAGYQVNDFVSVGEWFGAKPTADQYALGKQFLTIFNVKYEWVTMGQLGMWDLFEYHLKQAPLHILVPTRDTWNNLLVENVGPYTGVNHAIGMYAQEKNVSHSILDHYNPFLKKLSWDYYVPYALKGVVTLKKPEDVPQAFHYTFSANLAYGMGATEEVRNLQKALQYLGLMTNNLFGQYGPQTAAALGVFQKQHGIVDPDGPGRNFGPNTRAAMNQALLA